MIDLLTIEPIAPTLVPRYIIRIADGGLRAYDCSTENEQGCANGTVEELIAILERGDYLLYRDVRWERFPTARIDRVLLHHPLSTAAVVRVVHTMTGVTITADQIVQAEATETEDPWAAHRRGAREEEILDWPMTEGHHA